MIFLNTGHGDILLLEWTRCTKGQYRDVEFEGFMSKKFGPSWLENQENHVKYSTEAFSVTKDFAFLHHRILSVLAILRSF